MGDINPKSRIDLELYLPRTPVLSGAETARIMGFPTTEALYKARHAGRLPIDMFRLSGRRGWFAATHSVKEWLRTVISEEAVASNTEGGDHP
jgi:hypothetical protein